MEFLLQELPIPKRNSITLSDAEGGSSGFTWPPGLGDRSNKAPNERMPLLWSSSSSLYRFLTGQGSGDDSVPGTQVDDESARANEHLSFFLGLSALEIATIAHAKKFLSQNVVQEVIDDIWNGEIIFWDSLSVHSKKQPRIFNKR